MGKFYDSIPNDLGRSIPPPKNWSSSKKRKYIHNRKMFFNQPLFKAKLFFVAEAVYRIEPGLPEELKGEDSNASENY